MEALTLQQLQTIVEKLIAEYGENCPVLISETVFRKGAEECIIRHMESNDIMFKKELDMSPAFIHSQFDKGIVIGYVPEIV